MAVEVAYDIRRQVAIMWDNTTDIAFGPVFSGPGCEQDAEDFLDWLKRNPSLHSQDEHSRNQFRGNGTDPRHYTKYGLRRAEQRWREAADKYGSVEA